MDLAGLQPTTLSDFPGRIACTVFTAGCNLRCPYCHNPELLEPTARLETREFFDFLEERGAVLDGVVVSGGEPTLQEDLPGFVDRIADRGLDVKLDTNGTRPGVLAETLATGGVAYVAMDLKTVPARYDALGGPGVADAIERSARIVRERAPAFEFRTTFDPSVVDPADFDRLATLAGEGPLYVQSVDREDVLEPATVEATPEEPLATIAAHAGSVPDCVERRH